MSKPVTSAAVQQFFADYNQGKYPHQRVGQAFVNEFGREACTNHDHDQPAKIQGPCLFYQTSNGKAIKAIWEAVID